MVPTAGLGPQMAPQAPTDQTGPPAPHFFSKRFLELTLKRNGHISLKTRLGHFLDPDKHQYSLGFWLQLHGSDRFPGPQWSRVAPTAGKVIGFQGLSGPKWLQLQGK